MTMTSRGDGRDVPPGAADGGPLAAVDRGAWTTSDVPYPNLCETQPSLRWAVRRWRRRWESRGSEYTEGMLELLDHLVALFGPHRGDLAAELVRRFLVAAHPDLFHAMVCGEHAGSWEDCPGIGWAGKGGGGQKGRPVWAEPGPLLCAAEPIVWQVSPGRLRITGRCPHQPIPPCAPIHPPSTTYGGDVEAGGWTSRDGGRQPPCSCVTGPRGVPSPIVVGRDPVSR